MITLLLWALVATEHYDLKAEGVDAEDAGRMLEAFHAQATKFFGKAPKERLRIEIYGTRENWAAALEAERQPVPEGAGGYYSPATKKAYLYVQPTEYSTRHLILHEAAHQFHYLAMTANRNPADAWYTEGIAEYFAMHNWDGRELATGVVPAVTLEDRPHAALQNLGNVEGIVAGSAKADRPESWAIVHYLVNREPKRCRELFARLDRGERSKDAWPRTIGKVPSKEIREWIGRNPQPWRIVWIAWQERGGRIEGRSDTNGIALLKRTPERFEVEIEGTAKGGLVFGFRSAEEFHLFQVDGSSVRVVRRTGGAWQTVLTRDKPPAEGLDRLALETRGRLLANGVEVALLDVSGEVGLNVDGGRLLFRLRRFNKNHR